MTMKMKMKSTTVHKKPPTLTLTKTFKPTQQTTSVLGLLYTTKTAATIL